MVPSMSPFEVIPDWGTRGWKDFVEQAAQCLPWSHPWVWSKWLKSFTGECWANGWKVSLGSVEQVAEKFHWGVLSKWLKSFTLEYGASGCAVKFVWMEQAAMQWASRYIPNLGYSSGPSLWACFSFPHLNWNFWGAGWVKRIFFFNAAFFLALEALASKNWDNITTCPAYSIINS